jgi:transposase
METGLFEAALGLQEPLCVNEITFDKATGELHLYLDFARGAKFACPQCGAQELPVYDTVDKCWRHLNFFQYKCFIHFRTPRVKCPECGVRLWDAPWARRESGFTLLFEAFILQLAKAMAVSEIAALTGEHDTRIWRIVKGYVNKAYKEKDFSKVEAVGVDETSSRKGHNYVTVFANMGNGEVLFATKGKDSLTVKAFSEEIEAHGAQTGQIKEAAMDMSAAFIAGFGEYVPKAEITFDKFHVVKLLNEAVDEVRRAERKENPLLKGSRYIWLKNPENLTKKQQEQMKTLSKENLKTGKAYQMKLTFQDIYRNVRDRESAEAAIKKWITWAKRCRLEPMKGFAETVVSHIEGILHYFDTRLTSGKMEGINSRIQGIKRRARGFRNIDNFIAMIYLEAAGLNIPLPT